MRLLGAISGTSVTQHPGHNIVNVEEGGRANEYEISRLQADPFESKGHSFLHCSMDQCDSQIHARLLPPPVHGVGASNTYAVYGNGANKELTDLVPGILSQLGPDSLASLRKLAESYQAMNAAQMAQNAGAAGGEDDDEVPDVVSADVESVIEADKGSNRSPVPHSQTANQL